MRIALAFNLRSKDGEEEAELLTEADVERLLGGLKDLGHDAVPVEVSGPPGDVVDRLLEARPDLVFNVAEGRHGASREAWYPALYEQLHLPLTGGGTSLLFVDLDKRLAEKILAVQGIVVPGGALIRSRADALPERLRLPLMIKPNFEGSSKGITADSVVDNRQEAEARIAELLERFPDGVLAEEYVEGRELTVPLLEGFPGRLLEIVEHVLEPAPGGNGHRSNGDGPRIFDFDAKRGGGSDRVRVECPASLDPAERQAVLSAADRVFQVMPCTDLGRADFRLREDGVPVLIEVNPLPSLREEASLMRAAAARGLDFHDVLDRVVRTAAQRYGLTITRRRAPRTNGHARRTLRELGVPTGRLPPGPHNAITDVEHVKVGYVSRVEDDVPVPDQEGVTSVIRTGVTAVVPEVGDLFNNHLVAGGFVLNGIGEMSGLIQAMEWGWLETPILLTNTMSTGLVHNGIVQHMLRRHPELGRKVDVIIPLVGETNDGFLNDNRLPLNTPEMALQAIEQAQDGPIAQGNVGGGTGMISFDFAGGTGTASRRLPESLGGYTLGVLVQSNFGKMRNLTIDGMVVGRELDALFPYDGRRGRNYGSVIVVVATDAPLLSQQLSRLSKRAALGLGRVGSFAASTSGEIVFAFSTANRTSREAKERTRVLNLSFVPDERINGLYEAAVEATEEAVLNAVFCAEAKTGRLGRAVPALPGDEVLRVLERGRRPARPEAPAPDIRPEA